MMTQPLNRATTTNVRLHAPRGKYRGIIEIDCGFSAGTFEISEDRGVSQLASLLQSLSAI
jgi:hypothetical protein